MTITLFQPAAEIPAGTHWTQQFGGECRWIRRDRADLLAALQGPTPPKFRTILGGFDLDDEDRPTSLQGPAYFDLDGDLAETCASFRALLAKLIEHGVALDAVRLYATGGRGFHVEVAQAIFWPAAEPLPDLHKIYREMAQKLFVDCLDLRVYSSKRMWRVPNVRRDNNLFKVPLTPAEALTITPESYLALCAAPRPHPPLAAPPTLAPGLANLFERSRRKVADDARRRDRTKGKRSKAAELLKKRCDAIGAPLPPSILALASGRIAPRPECGWNQIAMQLAITAHAFDLDEDQLIELCAPLIAAHEGDSGRYGTPAKRERALRELHRHVGSSGHYDLSIGAIRSILPRDLPANDLRGV